MLCGFLPYDDDPENPDGENINLLYKYILESTLPFPSHCSTEAIELMKLILVADPIERITVDGIVKHAWMDSQRQTMQQIMLKHNKLSEMDVIKYAVCASEETICAVSESVISEFINQTATSAVEVTITPPSPIDKISMDKTLPLLPFTAEDEPFEDTPDFAQPNQRKSRLIDKAKHSLTRIKFNAQAETPPITPPRKVTLQPPAEQDNTDFMARKSLALSRTSFASGYAGSQYSIMQSNFEFTGRLPRLRYHSGPTDRRAITAKEPMGIVLDVEGYLLEAGYDVLIDSGKVYRLNVVRPRGFIKRGSGIQADVDDNRDEKQIAREMQYSKEKKHRFIRFISKLKMSVLYGSTWDKGYTASASQKPRFPLPHLTYPTQSQTYQSQKRIAEEIDFIIEIQKIRSFDLYVVEFKRVGGGIWEFKRMYEELMGCEVFAKLIESKYD